MQVTSLVLVDVRPPDARPPVPVRVPPPPPIAIVQQRLRRRPPARAPGACRLWRERPHTLSARGGSEADGGERQRCLVRHPKQPRSRPPRHWSNQPCARTERLAQRVGRRHRSPPSRSHANLGGTQRPAASAGTSSSRFLELARITPRSAIQAFAHRKRE